MTSANVLLKCRVCCSRINENESYDMRQLPMLALKFTRCTDLTVSDEEQLPSALCQTCYDLLDQLYAFRARCIEADAKWRLEIVAAPDRCNPVEQHESREKSKVEPLNEEREIELPQVETTAQDAIETAHKTVEQSTPPASNYKCDTCDMRFQVEHRLQAHMRQHEGLVPYPCTVAGCGRAFKRLHCLSEHMKEHSGINPWFNCQQEGCNKSYRHKPTLSMHMRRCHKLGPELKSHVCEFCGKVFSSTAVLNDHRYTHKDKSELPHACPETGCARRFSTKEKLKVHLMRHAGIKNFICPYCGMCKTTRNELKIHINYHTLERTWPCRFCSKVCNSSGNLKMHVRTVHERARDYACSYCERSFAKSDTRKYHEMTHTGEKPHECEECGKRFTQPAALRTHRKIHDRRRNETNETNSPVLTVLITASSDNAAPATNGYS